MVLTGISLFSVLIPKPRNPDSTASIIPFFALFSSISAIFTFVGQWLERTAKRDTGTGEPLTLVDIAGMRIRQSVTAELGKSYLAVKAAILGTMSPKLLSKELLREEIEAERKRLESGS